MSGFAGPDGRRTSIVIFGLLWRAGCVSHCPVSLCSVRAAIELLANASVLEVGRQVEWMSRFDNRGISGRTGARVRLLRLGDGNAPGNREIHDYLGGGVLRVRNQRMVSGTLSTNGRTGSSRHSGRDRPPGRAGSPRRPRSPGQPIRKACRIRGRARRHPCRAGPSRRPPPRPPRHPRSGRWRS